MKINEKKEDNIQIKLNEHFNIRIEKDEEMKERENGSKIVLDKHILVLL